MQLLVKNILIYESLRIYGGTGKMIVKPAAPNGLNVDFENVDNAELVSHINYIKLCGFKHDDLFDFPIEIIDYDSRLPVFLQKKFKIHAYKDWVNTVYTGESLVVDIYKAVLEILKNGNYVQFQNLDLSNEFDPFKFLEETISEETKHTELMKFFVKAANYNIELQDETQYLDQLINEKNIIQTLFHFYMGEVNVVVSLSLILRYSTNLDKKNFLKIILQEESKHVNGFLKLIKLVKKNITQDELESLDKFFTTRTFFLEYFGLNDLGRFIEYCNDNLLDSDPQKTNLAANFIESITKNKFQQEFNTLYKKKLFMYYRVLFPDVTEEEYNLKIDKTLNLFLQKFL